MRKTIVFSFILGLILYSPSLGLAENVSTGQVDILMGGERFGSIKEYRRKRLKEMLTEAISAESFKMFDENELMSILKEIKGQKSENTNTAESTTHQEADGLLAAEGEMPPEQEQLLMDSAQLQDMLDDYLAERGGGQALEIDPQKVKSIHIPLKPSTQN